VEEGEGLRLEVRGSKQEAKLRLREVRLTASELGLNLSLSLPIGEHIDE
jgi:hypothetical protein